MSRKSQNQNGQLARMEMQDPFREMHQMMRGFGGFQRDPFFGSMMAYGGDPFEDMFKFSDIHKNMHSKGSTGSYVCQSYVSSSKMGPDGKVVRQNYFQNSMGEHKNGNTISQKQQAYKNSSGINRIAEERMLNDKGRKIVRQKNGNNFQQTNHYYNIDEEQAERFDSDWKQTDHNLKFLQNHQKYTQQLGQQPKHRQLGYQPMRQERKEQKEYREPRQNRKNQIQYQQKSHKSQLRSTGQQSRGSKKSSMTNNSRKY